MLRWLKAGLKKHLSSKEVEVVEYFCKVCPKLNDTHVFLCFFFFTHTCIKDAPDSSPAVAMEERDVNELGQDVAMNTNEC